MPSFTSAGATAPDKSIRPPGWFFRAHPLWADFSVTQASLPVHEPEPGANPSAGSRLSQRAASGVVAGGATERSAPPAPPCWPPVADDRLGPLDQPTPRPPRSAGSTRRLPAVSHAPAAHKEDGLLAQSLYHPDRIDDEPNGIRQGIRDAPDFRDQPTDQQPVIDIQRGVLVRFALVAPVVKLADT